MCLRQTNIKKASHLIANTSGVGWGGVENTMSSIQVRVIRVALDGSGDYNKVQEAIDSVPLSNRTRTVIQVAPGLYKEPLYVPKTKNLITIAAYCPETTVISWNNTATAIIHHQASRVIGTGTFGCGSLIIEGEDLIAENITFENSAPQGSGQAVAVRVTADRCAFYNCRFLGWQVSCIHENLPFLYLLARFFLGNQVKGEANTTQKTRDLRGSPRDRVRP
ncbi:Pectinesterase 31 [Platanthera guangdongensis]|uniref:pectinesterase n=1 Tax=Platanthera guangdongensis TaxID=2320717 RepID=A0ABR2LHP8_9ASPA